MEALSFAQDLVNTLPVGQSELFNPWRDSCPYETPGNGPEARLLRLAAHLDCSPEFVLVGEAPGYQGRRYSGVAFTSERLLMDGAIPRVQKIAHRLSQRKLPFSEPSATIVWRTLYALGVAERTVLWNALQMHPYKPAGLWTNRTPTDGELALGAPALRLMRERFPGAQFVAVGKKAEILMASMGVVAAAAVRHPANGGAVKFATELSALIKDRDVSTHPGP